MTTIRGTGLPKPSRETKSSGAEGGREDLIFLVQLTTSRIGSITRLILTLAMCDDRTYAYMHTLDMHASDRILLLSVFMCAIVTKP